MDSTTLILEVEVTGLEEEGFLATIAGVVPDGLITNSWLKKPITPSMTCDSLPEDVGTIFLGHIALGILS